MLTLNAGTASFTNYSCSPQWSSYPKVQIQLCLKYSDRLAGSTTHKLKPTSKHSGIQGIVGSSVKHPHNWDIWWPMISHLHVVINPHCVRDQFGRASVSCSHLQWLLDHVGCTVSRAQWKDQWKVTQRWVSRYVRLSQSSQSHGKLGVSRVQGVSHEMVRASQRGLKPGVTKIGEVWAD